jgi:gamma-glutamyltranspeptidase / glutathione hydrolase
VVGMSSAGYAESRRALVGSGQAARQIPSGGAAAYDSSSPPAACTRMEPYRASAAADGSGSGTTFQHGAVDLAPAGGETTHLSVVDAQGNAVALTQTNSSTFGSGDRVMGFFLNDSGIDFSRRDDAGDAQGTGRSAWRVRRTTIAPTIVLRHGRVQMVVGAPGGGRIPTEIVQTMVYVLDYGMDPLEALRMPRIFPAANSPRVELENGFNAALLGQIRAMGYEPVSQSFGYARLYMIARRGDRWVGAADPRHNGEVRGY